jgi:hypothetical protein
MTAGGSGENGRSARAPGTRCATRGAGLTAADAIARVCGIPHDPPEAPAAGVVTPGMTPDPTITMMRNPTAGMGVHGRTRDGPVATMTDTMTDMMTTMIAMKIGEATARHSGGDVIPSRRQVIGDMQGQVSGVEESDDFLIRMPLGFIICFSGGSTGSHMALHTSKTDKKISFLSGGYTGPERENTTIFVLYSDITTHMSLLRRSVVSYPMHYSTKKN